MPLHIPPYLCTLCLPRIVTLRNPWRLSPPITFWHLRIVTCCSTHLAMHDHLEAKLEEKEQLNNCQHAYFASTSTLHVYSYTSATLLVPILCTHVYIRVCIHVHTRIPSGEARESGAQECTARASKRRISAPRAHTRGKGVQRRSWCASRSLLPTSSAAQHHAILLSAVRSACPLLHHTDSTNAICAVIRELKAELKKTKAELKKSNAELQAGQDSIASRPVAPMPSA